MILLLLVFRCTPIAPLALAALSVAWSLLDQGKRPIGTFLLTPATVATCRTHDLYGYGEKLWP
jgi:hypothetical protein